jgi:hypothetical protein
MYLHLHQPAEDAAKEGKKGKWGSKTGVEAKVVDLTNDTKMAKDHFPYLQRMRNVRGTLTVYNFFDICLCFLANVV